MTVTKLNNVNKHFTLVNTATASHVVFGDSGIKFLYLKDAPGVSVPFHVGEVLWTSIDNMEIDFNATPLKRQWNETETYHKIANWFKQLT